MADFLVRIEYREPSYETVSCRKLRPYRWTYRIEAATAELAKLFALGEFRRMAELSSVGWGRQVTGVAVHPASPG